MREPLERSTEERVRKWAEAQGFLVYKLAFVSRRGATDRLFVSPNGDIIFAEFKRQRTGKLSPAQRDFRQQVTTRGLIHYVFRTYDEATAALEKFL